MVALCGLPHPPSLHATVHGGCSGPNCHPAAALPACPKCLQYCICAPTTQLHAPDLQRAPATVLAVLPLDQGASLHAIDSHISINRCLDLPFPLLSGPEERSGAHYLRLPRGLLRVRLQTA